MNLQASCPEPFWGRTPGARAQQPRTLGAVERRWDPDLRQPRILQHRPAPFPRPPRFLCDPPRQRRAHSRSAAVNFPPNCNKPSFKVITFLLFPLKKKKKTYRKKSELRKKAHCNWQKALIKAKRTSCKAKLRKYRHLKMQVTFRRRFWREEYTAIGMLKKMQTKEARGGVGVED